MKIDVHAHFVDPAYLDALQSQVGLQPEETSDGKTLWRHDGFTVAWSRPDMFDIDERLRTMDRMGIDIRVLSLSTPNVYQWKGDAQLQIARQMNDTLAKICSAHPDRFIGLASLPLANVEASIAELDRCMDTLGMKGAAIGSSIDGVALTRPEFEPLWAHLDARRIPVFEHPMFPKNTEDLQEFELPLRVGLIYETTLVASRLIYAGIFERYPNFAYIMAHTGGALLMLLERLDNGYRLFPDCRKYITRLPSEYAKHLFYDTTAFDKQALMMAIEKVGVSQLMFGTDDPFIGADTAHVDCLALSDAQKAEIFGGTAARVFGLAPR